MNFASSALAFAGKKDHLPATQIAELGIGQGNETGAWSLSREVPPAWSLGFSSRLCVRTKS